MGKLVLAASPGGAPAYDDLGEILEIFLDCRLTRGTMKTRAGKPARGHHVQGVANVSSLLRKPPLRSLREDQRSTIRAVRHASHDGAERPAIDRSGHSHQPAYRPARRDFTPDWVS